MSELAKRAIACKHWRWMEGMAVFNPDLPEIWYPRVGRERTPQHRFLLPDLTDPATLGCLLAILREVRGMCSCFETAVGWRVYSAGGTLWSQGKSEGDALVAALEAAP